MDPDRPRWTILRADTELLAAFAVLALSALVGLKLGSEVMEGDTLALDGAILRRLSLLAHSPTGLGTWLRGAMLDMTALGDNATLALVVLLVTFYLLIVGRRRLALLLLAATALGILASFGLKELFLRPRPDIVQKLVAVDTPSFPSGHAMNSAIVYLTLGALLARTERRRAARLYVVGAALLLTLLIGFSRLYLGVHWPSDVLAGWIFGAGWATAASLFVLRFQQGSGAEPPI